MNFMILFILSHSFQSKNLHLYPKDLSQVKGDINSLILQDIQFSTFDLQVGDFYFTSISVKTCCEHALHEEDQMAD